MSRASERRAERRAYVKEHGLPPGVEHGASAYSNWGCKCDICTRANADAALSYKARVKPRDPDGRIRFVRNDDGSYRTSDSRFMVLPRVLGASPTSKGQQYFQVVDLGTQEILATTQRLYEARKLIDEQYDEPA